MKKIVIFTGFFMAVAFAQTQTIRYVTPNGTGDGSSWTNAAGDIQGMVNASNSGDQVWIAGGNYPLAATLTMKSGVNVYGGFVSGDTAVADRAKSDLDANGIIEDWEFANAAVLDGQNARQVLLQSSSFTVETVWDGVTITGGQGGIGNAGCGAYIKAKGNLRNCIVSGNNNSSSASVAGGGIYSDSGTVSYCLISNNQIATNAASADAAGSGIFNKGGTINHCTISNNTVSSTTSSAKVAGGGVYNENGTVTRCIISNNTVSTSAYSDAAGGGVYTNGGTINFCTISGNTVFSQSRRSSGGGIYIDYNGGIINHCTVSGNTASYSDSVDANSSVAGGGISCINATTCIVNDCTIENNKTLYKTTQSGYGGGVFQGNINRCIIKGNTAGSGGGICQSVVRNSLLLNNNALQYGGGAINCNTINCTFVENKAGTGGGGLFGTSSSAATAANCIFWKNTALIGAQAFTAAVAYSAVQGVYTGTGNINIAADNAAGPRFVNPTAADYQLQENSPCVNVGNNSGISPSDIDLARNPRIYGETVDMGAYELQNFSVTGISLSPKKITLNIGDSAVITASVVPYYAANKNISVVNTDSTVAYMLNSKIYAISEGKSFFIFTTEEGGFSDTCVVTVNYVGIATNTNYELRIYPNPTKGALHITRNALQENAIIELYDIYGKNVFTSPNPSKGGEQATNVAGINLHTVSSPPLEGLGEVVIDISHLAKGMYFLKVDNRMYKVIKQ
jgi:hypothetical protein